MPCPGHVVTPGDLGLAEPDVTVSHIAEPERDRLRHGDRGARRRVDAAALLRSPQTRRSRSPRRIPGSLPQFITGRSTLLSNLFRDEVALRNARLAAERITAKNLELRTTRGLEPVHLAVGLALVAHRRRSRARRRCCCARSRSAGTTPTSSSSCTASSWSTPSSSARCARTSASSSTAPALAALAHDGGVFKPQPVIDHLRALTASIETFTVKPRLLVSSFADVGGAMARDAADLDHPILNALAGHPDDREALTRGRAASRRRSSPDERPPAADTLLLDADAEQEARPRPHHRRAVARRAHAPGHRRHADRHQRRSARSCRDGKRVLVVSARRSTLEGVRHRLAGIGLPGLAVSPRDLQRDLIRAIGRNEKAEQPKIADIDDALVRLRGVLRDYRGAVTAPHPVARRLGARDPARPRATRRRSEHRALDRRPLRPRRPSSASPRHATEAAAKLAAAARLGEFRFGPDDSPWYGVTFATTEQARAAHGLAAQAAPPGRARRCSSAATSSSRRRACGPFQTIAELGVYLRLLQGIRDSLDRFSPTVFERPLGELIQAHGPRRDAPSLSGANRRRLRRLVARVRAPGRARRPTCTRPSLRIQQQRTEWQRYVDAGRHPRGAARPRRRARRLAARRGRPRRARRASSAASGADRLATLPGRAARADARRASPPSPTSSTTSSSAPRCAPSSPRSASSRCSPSSRCATCPRTASRGELEFAWWQSALEHLLRTDRALLGANTAVVDRLERDFRLVDEAHAAASGPLLAAQLATQWRIGIVDEPDEAAALKRALKRRRGRRPPSSSRAAPTLLRTLAPVWLASPYDVPDIPDDPAFDVVIIADAAALCLAEAAPALRRARQVVVFGDPVTQKPTPFRVAAGGRPVRRRADDEPFDDDQRVRAPRRAAPGRDAHPQLPRRRRRPRRARQRRVLRRRARVAAVGGLVPRPRQPQRRLRRGRQRARPTR